MYLRFLKGTVKGFKQTEAFLIQETVVGVLCESKTHY